MKTKFYIVTNRRGTVRTTVRQPDISRDEIAVAVNLEIPDSCFRTATMTAALTVAADKVIQPTEVKVTALNPDAPPAKP